MFGKDIDKFMIIKEKFKEKNLYLLDAYTQFHCRRQVKDFYEQSNQLFEIDSIADVEELTQTIKKLDRSTFIEIPGQIAPEGAYYGHIQQLYQYANIPLRRYIYTPWVDHGVAFGGENIEVNSRRFNYCYIAPGPYRKKSIHCGNPYIPAYCIGPYIYYAKPYYDDDKMREVKTKLGRTILVILTHTIETECVSVNWNVVQIIKNLKKKAYDTIMVCIYWNDLDKPYVSELKDLGVKIVSAGVRWDSNFICRLRSIFELADDVITDGLGTHIGYAVALKKNISFFENADIQYETKKLAEIHREFVEAFNSDNTSMQMELYNYYWGGDLIRTPDEIRAILMNCRNVLKMAKYNADNYENALCKYIKNLKKSAGNEEKLCYHLLMEALRD